MAVPPTLLQIDLMGKPRWRLAGGRSGDLSALDAALFALLALDGAQAQAAMAGRLFPLHRPPKSDANLRKHVERLRRKTGHLVFVTGGGTLSLADGVAVDARDIAALPIERLLGDELLAGCDYTAYEFLNDWVAGRRTLFGTRRGEALAVHAEALETRGDVGEAIQLAEAIVELAPERENGWRRLMHLHHLRGDHTAAVEAFERFERILFDGTGKRPGPVTRQLLATIELGQRAPQARVVEVPANLVRPPTRIGHDDAWRAIAAAWDTGHAFVLVGEAGIGKSRLLQELAVGRRSGARVLHERGRGGDSQAPFTLLARLLRAALDAAPTAPARLPRRELARLLPELGRVPDTPAEELRLRKLAERVLAACGEVSPLCVVIDDLHHADLATLEALRWLATSQALTGVRFAFATRPLPGGPAAALLRDWLQDSLRPDRIELRPLGSADVAALLGTLGLPQFEQPEFVDRLYRHANGHPLWTLETLKHLHLHPMSPVERGLDGPLPVPASVQALVEHRLDQLAPLAQRLVGLAAVADIDFDAVLASRLLDLDPLALAEPWQQLEKADVLHGERFASDLMHQCALARVPPAVARRLHARIAEGLAADARVPPARIASHWQAARCTAEAGAWWQRAGLAARRAGRLDEQQALLERAAACHRSVDDKAGEFDAVHASLDGLLLRHGGAAVLAAMPRLEALARAPQQRLRCRLVEAEALIERRRFDDAYRVASEAVALAAGKPLLIADAWCLQGMALARLGRFEEAIAACRQAVAGACAAGLPAQELRGARSLAYALFVAGRLGEALPVQRRAAELADAVDDEAESVAAEVSLSALLLAVGDAPAAHRHAERAWKGCAEMGLGAASALGAAALNTLGRTAACAGRFDVALEALTTAARASEADIGALAGARARIALAAVLVVLGGVAAARELAGALPALTPVALRMQAALVMARAAEINGNDPTEPLQRLARLGTGHVAEMPILESEWWAWSHAFDAGTVVARLETVQRRFADLGLTGAARALRLRIVARLAELDDDASRTRAADHAKAISLHVARGLGPRVYPPDAWLVLARAFDRVDDRSAAARCRAQALRWLHEQALPNVPRAYLDGFVRHNPTNRELLRSAGLQADRA